MTTALATAHPSAWYRLIDDPADRSLEQGDLLFGLYHLVPTAYVLPWGAEDRETLTNVKLDVVVMTASCDLAHPGKIDYVVLCPHFDFEEGVKNQRVKAQSKVNMEKGYMPRYCLLSACDLPTCRMGVRVVDFNRVLQIPRPLVEEHIRNGAPRLRMLPPYREHLALAFGMCYTRVGLPRKATETGP